MFILDKQLTFCYGQNSHQVIHNLHTETCNNYYNTDAYKISRMLFPDIQECSRQTKLQHRRLLSTDFSDFSPISTEYIT